jgi:hypothetical protein
MLQGIPCKHELSSIGNLELFGCSFVYLLLFPFWPLCVHKVSEMINTVLIVLNFAG